MTRVLLVTIAIGEKYLNEYNEFFRWSQENYAKRHGYDFRVVMEYLDPELQNKKVVSLQKLLVGCQTWSADYDWIVFIDADVLIHKDMPPIHTAIDFQNKIGIVDEINQPNPEARQRIRIITQDDYGTASGYYEKCGFTLQTEHMLNSGVFIFEPSLHGEWLKEVYLKYRTETLTHPRGFHFEQAAFGYELITQNRFVVLPDIWNRIHFFYCMTDPLKVFTTTPSFLHFAGSAIMIPQFSILNTKYAELYTNRRPTFGYRPFLKIIPKIQ